MRVYTLCTYFYYREADKVLRERWGQVKQMALALSSTLMIDHIIRSRRVLTPMLTAPASIHLDGDKIAAIREWDDVPPGIKLTDASGSVVMPGNVDAHVHVNEPGRTEWEGYETATAAAAAGGVTCIVDMPLNSI